MSALTESASTTCPAPVVPAARAVDRRELLSRPFARLAAGVAAAGGATTVAACEMTRAPFDRELHLLRRLTYGPTPEERATIAELGEAGWLAAQADPGSLDTSAVDAKIAQLPALSMSAAELSEAYPDGVDAVFAAAQLKVAFSIRTTDSPAQLFERMVEFWSDHFNVPMIDRNLALLKLVEDREVIRPNALGTFKDLLVGSAQSPAMLLYLDNAFSFRGRINENYSRELLELHTVGRDGGYDEDDVVALARLLTGWSINRSTFEFEFVAAEHDPAPLSIMGWTRPAGNDHLQHGVDFLHWLAEQPATATFVCTKLARRFVTDAPPPALVEAMTDAWSTNDTAIMPLVRAMVDHPAFDESAGTKLRRPLDFSGFVLRALRAEVTPTANVRQFLPLYRYLVALGQAPFEWPAPNGYPDVEGAWLNAGALLGRWNLVGDLIAGLSPNVTVDASGLADGLDGATSREVYDAVAERLVFEPTTEEGQIVLDRATGWSATTTPSASELADALGPIVITLLTSTGVQYR